LKFACDRCGKRYASVDEPAAGRVYRIRCRCGHVIVVRGSASALRGAADVELQRFAPVPPPLATPAPEEPSSAREPRRAPNEGKRSLERPPDAGEEPAPAPALGTAASAAPMDEGEPVVHDDPFLRAAAGAEPDTMGSAGATKDGGWAARPPECGEAPAAESGEPLEVGAAALPAVALRPALSLGLDEEGARGARRRVLLAAIIALLAAVAALAASRL
jgi:hypothetical protein